MKFIPTVGEACVCVGFLNHRKVTPKFVGIEHTVFDHDGNEFSMFHIAFEPIKSSAEIERENDVIELTNIVNEWLTTTNSAATLVNLVLDSQCVENKLKQQVKTLSYDEFKVLLYPLDINRDFYSAIYAKIKPFLRQGGDK